VDPRPSVSCPVAAVSGYPLAQYGISKVSLLTKLKVYYCPASDNALEMLCPEYTRLRQRYVAAQEVG
jgi:hypothetical protein